MKNARYTNAVRLDHPSLAQVRKRLAYVCDTCGTCVWEEKKFSNDKGVWAEGGIIHLPYGTFVLVENDDCCGVCPHHLYWLRGNVKHSLKGILEALTGSGTSRVLFEWLITYHSQLPVLVQATSSRVLTTVFLQKTLVRAIFELGVKVIVDTRADLVIIVMSDAVIRC